MKNRENTKDIKKFYNEIKKVLEIKVEKVSDLRRFYIEINNLAFTIIKNKKLLVDLRTGENNNDPKFLNGISYILGYGSAVNKNKSILGSATSKVKEINLSKYFKDNSKRKIDTLNFALKARQKLVKLDYYIKNLSGEEIQNIIEENKILKEDKKNLKDLVSSLQEQLKIKNGIKQKKHITIPIPNFEWEKLTLKFKEGMQELDICYEGKLKKIADFVQLGFSANKTNTKKDVKWQLLEVLSALPVFKIKSTTDDLRIGLSNKKGHDITNDAVHQTVKRLSDLLKSIFLTKADPFTHDTKEYKSKFKIEPSPVLRRDQLWESKYRLNDNIDNSDRENF